MALAAAGGAASVTGIALPGRFDELVRVAVVRRYPGSCAGVGGVCLSLLLLGLIDSASLAPLAAISAGVIATTGLFRAGLIVVAVAGIAAAAVVLLLPTMARANRLSRFRLARWLREHSTSPREASKAWALISLSWLVRGAALFVLLDALALDASIPLALAFLCASAAAAALPIAPAGRRDPGRRRSGDARGERRRSFAGGCVRGRGAGARDHDGRADRPRRRPLAGKPPPAAAPSF